ncbi:thioredoxin family protein [Thiohalorhabdus denitrificans]|uniref:Thioredoxin-like n=1 Tax=Thiohalorhabdus denitrificans TaxID=381306 RepID=A0A1G5AHJ6_9GAMM|nr:thioredoxin family protein [Thiohalorhabdus denitrificans]SCX77384.1 Thioredoxin-like [Thiohalorhabdus denitrificans]
MTRLIPLLGLLLLGGPAYAGEIPAARDLAATAQEAGSQDRPVLVFFYQDECPYCEAVRENYLGPIMKNDSYTSRIALREVNTRDHSRLKDFHGEETSHRGFAEREDAPLTPTVAFYGPEGRQLTDPLVGLKGGTEYYGHYLDEAIDEAERALAEER